MVTKSLIGHAMPNQVRKAIQEAYNRPMSPVIFFFEFKEEGTYEIEAGKFVPYEPWYKMVFGLDD